MPAILLSLLLALAPQDLPVPSVGERPSAPELFLAAVRAFAPDGEPVPATLELRGELVCGALGTGAPGASGGSDATGAGGGNGALGAPGAWLERHGTAGEGRAGGGCAGATVERGVAGGLAWELDARGVARALEGREADVVLRRFAWLTGRGLRGLYNEARHARFDDARGRATVTLAAPFRRCAHDHEAQEVLDTLVVELASGRPLELRFAEHAADGTRFERVLLLSGWREHEGRVLPTERRERVGDAELVVRIDSIAVGAELAPDAFAPPEAVRAAAGAPPAVPAFALADLAPQPTAVVRVRCRPHEVGAQVGIALPLLATRLRSAGKPPFGPPFARQHPGGDGDLLELELGFPLAAPIERAEGCEPSSLPAGTAAVGWHVGPHHALAETRERLARWIEEQGLVPAGAPWEVYWSDPSTEADPERWRTQLVWPVARKH